ncbi:hypothetical protein Sango_1593600 [Sesamum angolense]|uniref:Chromo domain-containing protein n=1 Tax=Sesamum angolense TaxID=2727404 RepID=A0AAE1WQB8_9LAMI|nr:hypothetical protein Sango_1593600 [Sesamum angolense]
MDAGYLKLVDQVKSGLIRKYWLDNGLLHAKDGQVFVPMGTLRRRLFREIHDPQWAGHPGIDRMVALLARRYYWPRMEEDVEAYVNGMASVLVVVDRFFKYGIFIDAPHACSAETAAELLFKNVTKYFGVPKDILPMVAQRRMKKYADMGRRHVEFGAGDQMLLKLTPQIWKKISSKSVHRGLIPKYDGPFEVMSKVGSLAYRLKLPDHLKIHPTFHEFEKTVLKILDHRMIGQSKKNRRTDYLVHWSGESEADATWEQDVTLWQFEEKLDEYWVMREGVTPPTRALGSSGGGAPGSSALELDGSAQGLLMRAVTLGRLQTVSEGLSDGRQLPGNCRPLSIDQSVRLAD